LLVAKGWGPTLASGHPNDIGVTSRGAPFVCPWTHDERSGRISTSSPRSAPVGCRRSTAAATPTLRDA